MAPVVHFEIHVDDLARARAFYEQAFDWTFQDWSEFAGMPYLGATTQADGQGGINGALMQRQSKPVKEKTPVKGAVLTVQVDDYDAAERKILAAGGTVAMGRYALPGMAWQGYYMDTEGNPIGIHQPDPEAR